MTIKSEFLKSVGCGEMKKCNQNSVLYQSGQCSLELLSPWSQSYSAAMMLNHVLSIKFFIALLLDNLSDISNFSWEFPSAKCPASNARVLAQTGPCPGHWTSGRMRAGRRGLSANNRQVWSGADQWEASIVSVEHWRAGDQPRETPGGLVTRCQWPGLAQPLPDVSPKSQAEGDTAWCHRGHQRNSGLGINLQDFDDKLDLFT